MDAKAAGDNPVKKGKLTKEQKKALKKQRALQRKLAAEEARRQAIRDQLQREIKFTKLTYEKSARNWEQLCVDIKIPEVQQEVRATVQGLQRAFDRKNYFIERLRNDIETSSEQYRNNFVGHFEAVDSFIEYYKYFMEQMKRDYEVDCRKLLDNFQQECNERYALLDSRERFLKTSEYDKNVVTIHAAKIQENYITNIRYDAKAELQIYQEHLEEKYWKNHMGVVKDMLDLQALIKRTTLSPENLKVHQALNDALLEDDRKYAQQLEMDETHMKLIRGLERRVAEEEFEYARTLNDMKHVKLHLKNCFSMLEQKFNNEIKEDKKTLHVLITHSEDILKHLEKLYKDGEGVLSDVTISRKYETQEEKVMPWPEVTEAHERASDTEISATVDTYLREITQMELFWRRLTKVVAQNYALREEKEKLTAENEKLQECIKRCWCFNMVQRNMNNLRISMYPTSVIPTQIASHIPQIALAKKNACAAAKARANARRNQ